MSAFSCIGKILISCNDYEWLVIAVMLNHLLELSSSPHFIPAIGHFGNGSIAEVNFSYWSRLHENTYFARLSTPVPKPDQLFHWRWQGHTKLA